MGTQQLEISISCRALPGEALSGVRVAVSICPEGGTEFVEVGQTETVIGNINPIFARTIPVVYHFEHSQNLRFILYGVDGRTEKITGNLGKVECSLADVLSRGGAVALPLLPGTGSVETVVTIQTRATPIGNQAVRLQFCARHIHLPCDDQSPNTFFTVLLSPEGERQQLLYKSETVSGQNPEWSSFLIPVTHFSTHATRNCPVQLALYQHIPNAQDNLVGRTSTSLDRLLKGVCELNVYELSASGKRKKDVMSIELLNIFLVACPSFIDFIKGGTGMHFSVAVDFTASNGNPFEPSSLHYIDPLRFNPYMIALTSVSTVIEKYSKGGGIAAFGFGAQIPPDFKVSHLFFMNGTSDPHVQGVDGILQAYRSSLLAIRPYAPTDFSEVIYHIYKFAAVSQKQCTSEHYFVLLIVTDGCVTDPRKTLDAIVSCSYLPMSIVIVGVGQRDYGPMEQLLSPMLKSSDGKPLMREIVTFVAYDNSITDSQLAARLLVNIPKQFLTWALHNNRMPGQKSKIYF